MSTLLSCSGIDTALALFGPFSLANSSSRLLLYKVFPTPALADLMTRTEELKITQQITD